MSALSRGDSERIGRELAESFQGLLSWKCDGRFEAVLAEFPVAQKDAVRAVLEKHLPTVWDNANVGNAPDIVRAVETHFGGLWPGQLLFTSDPKSDALVFGTWWPWGDGKEISIRVGASFRVLAEAKRAERMARFRNCFGV